MKDKIKAEVEKCHPIMSNDDNDIPLCENSLNVEYPLSIIAAVDWWAKDIQNPQGIPVILSIMFPSVQQSDEKIKFFKKALANYILEELNENGFCTLSVFGCEPCEILSKVRETSGLSEMVDFSWNTLMNITNSSVQLSQGIGEDITTVYLHRQDEEAKLKLTKRD